MSEEPVKIGSAAATVRKLRLPMGLEVDEVILDAGAANLQREPFNIALDNPGSLTATVLEPALEAFLNAKAPGNLRDFKIQIAGGKLIVEATAKIVFEVRATAVCTLRIVDQAKLYVDLESVELLGVGAKNLVQQQLDQINPILDAAEFPVKLKMTSVECDRGQIVLRGTVEP